MTYYGDLRSYIDALDAMGDIMHVKVIAIDDQDRVKLSRKQVLREQKAKQNGNENKGA